MASSRVTSVWPQSRRAPLAIRVGLGEVEIQGSNSHADKVTYAFSSMFAF